MDSRFYHADGLGSIRALTDEGGAVTDRYDFSAFGELLEHEGEDPNAYLFAGEPLDPNSGFVYLRARWMDPTAGRFASTDRFSGDPYAPVTLHKYLYAANDPIDNLDPTGNETLFGLQVSTAVMGIVNSIVIGFYVGAIFGGLEAKFTNQDVVAGALQGATWGALLGPLGRIKILGRFLMYMGMLLSGTASYRAYMEGETDLALLYGIVFVAGLVGVLVSGGQSHVNTGNVKVYRSINPVNDEVQYVGITENFAARAIAHLRSWRHIVIEEIPGLQNLSRYDARCVEQVLIEYYGLGKNGGTLLNLINSISPRNPIYAQALIRGRLILQMAGYPGF